MSAKKTDQNPPFEESLEQLEALVEEMEGGELPLEKLIVRYEQGTKLLKQCEQSLKTAEEKIEILRNKDAENPDFETLETNE